MRASNSVAQILLRLRPSSSGLLASVLLILSASSFAETRGYVFSNFHMATRRDPSDCPQGGNGDGTEILRRVLINSGRSNDEAKAMLADRAEARFIVKDAEGHLFNTDARGHLNGQAVSISLFPAAVPDPHIETVQGHFAYGFNLDGRVTADAFEDPDTHEPVKNQLWRVYGCFVRYQKPLSEMSAGWDYVFDAMPVWLVSISGSDLSKDGDVTVTFDRSLNVGMRNVHGGALSGASYTTDPDPRSHSVFKGRLRNHVVTVEPGNFFMQGEQPFYQVIRFTQTHLRLTLNANGSLSGFIGGYQPWLDVFDHSHGEDPAGVNLPGVYYAMKRLADGAPDPATGQNMAISAAYYLEAVPAFIVNGADKVVSVAYMGDAAPRMGDAASR
jgi:hypothetical protein